MKKILVMMIIIMLVLAKFLLPVNAVSLEKLSRPSMFLVNFERIYVLEQASVYIYSLKDYRLIKKFGKAGEGPKEFKYNGGNVKPLSMNFFNGQLLVNSDLKVSFFDIDGKYIKEKKISVDRLIFPIENKYIGVGPTRGENKKQFIGFTLYDNDFKSNKIIHIGDLEMSNPNRILLPMTSFTYNPIHKEKIYICANSTDFKINVYNANGEKERVITKNYPKLKVPDSYKKEAFDFIKKSPQYKRMYEFFKKVLQTREYFPPIRDMSIIDDFIYVLTFKRKDDLWECIKLDLEGNEKGRAFIALSAYEHITFYPNLYTVYKDRIYTLVEDEEDEIWKIHTSGFKSN